METQKYPVAGTDYPRTFQEFDIWFASEENCLQYVAKLRWPDGFRCPSCGVIAENPSLMERGLYLCRQCKHQTSITAGTLFHKTHKPLRIWFLAMWFVTSQKHGASALGLKRVLGLGSYNTAWEWLHKLRRGMVRPGRDQLKSPVEVDETYIGGVGAQIRGRGAEGKTIVAIAAEIRGKGPGRIRMAVVPDVSSESLHTFIEDNVQMGSEVRTDGWSGYKGLEDKGYRHKVINIAASGDPAHVVMPRVHRAWVYGLWNTPSRKALPGGRWRVVPILACAHRYCTYFSRGLMPKILVGSGVTSFFISSRQASGAELI
nr:IS1595 family transposase [uncultured Desulfobulbus sp.]